MAHDYPGRVVRARGDNHRMLYTLLIVLVVVVIVVVLARALR